MKTDVVVLGGGAAGLAAVREARRRGAATVMVTASSPGGDCTFTGCVPSKTLIEAANNGASFDEAFARVRFVIDQIAATETVEVLRAEGVTVIEDVGVLSADGSIKAGGHGITAKGVVLATGSRPAVPGIPGLREVMEDHPGAVHTSDTIWDLDQMPASMIIVGGGAIGCELGLAMSKLGVHVTIVEAMQRLLAAEEPTASEIVTSACSEAGIEVFTNHRVEAISADGTAAEVIVTPGGHADALSARSKQRSAGRELGTATSVNRTVLRANIVLLATGRSPSVDSFSHLEVTEQGFVRVSDDLSTSITGVYAAGDVNGLSLFTHAADAMGRLATSNILRRLGRGTFRANQVPRVVFTSPEVASIGLSESEAAALSKGAQVAELPLSEHDRARTAGVTDGYIKLIAGPRRFGGNIGGGRLLGASIVAPRAGEMISELSLLMRLDAMVGRLAQTMHPYPSWSYGLAKTAGQFFTEVEGRSARSARI